MKAQRLQLARPIISFDLETTGLDIGSDRVVEMCCVKIQASGEREIRTLRLNPGRPIAPQATAVHGITDADVADAPHFEAAARDLHAYFAGCDLTGFNIEHFDLPLLTNEFGRAGLAFPFPDARVIDSFRIFIMREPRDLSAALRFYCNRELTEAHHAEADALAAADVLLAQVDRYSDLPEDVPALHAVCRPPDWLDGQGKVVWVDEDAVISFGKHKGKSLRVMVEHEASYLQWICGGKSSFAPDVVDIMRKALNGMFPEKPIALRAAVLTEVVKKTTVDATPTKVIVAKPVAATIAPVRDTVSVGVPASSRQRSATIEAPQLGLFGIIR
ncbi:MAG: 3'-5' exonuclease [Clostridia bacterium]|nr:3'-5' exonuclease [Deltaproteobacteria bacterium]